MASNLFTVGTPAINQASYGSLGSRWIAFPPWLRADFTYLLMSSKKKIFLGFLDPSVDLEVVFVVLNSENSCVLVKH